MNSILPSTHTTDCLDTNTVSSADCSTDDKQLESYIFDYAAVMDTGIPVDSLGLLQRKKQKTVHWSILWSDIMMTMFVLFLVLYVHKAIQQGFSLGKPKAASEQKIETTPALSRQKNQMEILPPPVEHVYEWGIPLMRDKLFSDLRSIEFGPDQAVRIVLPGDVLFDTGQLELRATARDSLREIADLLKRFPYMVNVVGHTDAAPSNSERYGTNWELSSLRACAVARFLMEEMKLPEERFYVSGYAHIKPAYSDDTIENRAANRRVEILITRDLPFGRHGRLRELPLGGGYHVTGRK